MNFKLAVSALVLGSAFATIPGCAVDAPQDEADAEEAATSADELNATAKKLVGAFHGQGTARPPTFEGIVFAQDGTFFGDLDTGIRCIMAPCPSGAHVEGSYTATKSYLRLTAKAGTPSNDFYGRYKYTLAGEKLALSRTTNGSTWTQKLDKGLSYCAAPADCDGQALIHPMCVGGWTCGAANTCGYKCGIPANDGIWPATATKLVAESPGGGFAPPAPPGSNCAIGKQKYSLDRATRVMTSEICELSGGKLLLKSATTTITAAELLKINKAMDAVKIATQDMCGADKPFLSIKVTTPAGEKTYTDSFYRCQGGNRTYVDGIDGVFGAMRDAL
ncbi:MAG TPA: hypothetical protein VLT33_36870 [Labilithrix sp.]|nr:hypothetical protein [Labilithrix sp.]